MKYVISILMLLSAFTINPATGQKSIQINGQTFYQVSTISELKLMGKKYGLEDYVSENNNQHLQYETKQDAENYFKQEYETREAIKETEQYLSKTRYVKTPEDWIKLVESMPKTKKELIQLAGSEEKYEAYKQELLCNEQRIYRMPGGCLIFMRYAIKEDKSILPKDVIRIDNLPKY